MTREKTILKARGLLLGIAVLFSSLLACKTRTDDPASDLVTQEVVAQPPKTTPIAVIMMGYASCDDDGSFGATGGGFADLVRNFYQRMDGLSPFANDQGKIRSIETCFDKEGNISLRFRGFPEYRNFSTTNREFYRIKMQNLYGAKAIFDRIAREIPDHSFHVVGHSYGGWVALRLASELDSSVKIGSLWTLDPINPFYCTPMAYILRLGIVTPKACKQAPADIDGETREKIMSHLKGGAWHHIYQTAYGYLHAGPFEGMPQPQFSLDVTNAIDRHYTGGGKEHVSLARFEAIWTALEGTIKREIGIANGADPSGDPASALQKNASAYSPDQLSEGPSSDL